MEFPRQNLIHKDLLLQTDESKQLYHDHSADQPLIDYHCHLSPEKIADDYQFADISEMWLEGDHYKWRAMRTNGIPEKFCTGSASPREKFDAWAETVPYTLRNPLYHWSHLELNRYFGVDHTIDPSNADAIWEECNSQLGKLTVHKILEQFNVAALCTTDDPANSLDPHKRIALSGLKTKVYPTFRPDNALAIESPREFRAWVENLEDASSHRIHSLDTLLDALEKRHQDFHNIGGRLSDHGLETCWSTPATKQQAQSAFEKAWQGTVCDQEELANYKSFLMKEFGKWDAKRGWTKQLHLGAMRDSNSVMFDQLGSNTGFDSIGDLPQTHALARYLDGLNATGQLPKMIIYNLNPSDNYSIATMIGNFQDGSIAGKLQFGSGWWFLDQEEAMRWQMNALSNLGLLRRFVGMLTDSRSFLSFPRHEYFRRTLCNLLGEDINTGRLPRNLSLIGELVEEISFKNARNYFGLDLHESFNLPDQKSVLNG